MFHGKTVCNNVAMIGLGSVVIISTILSALSMGSLNSGNDIQELINQCVEVNTMHVVASVQGRVFALDPDTGLDEGSNGAIIYGSFEYWADGDNYRMRNYLDPTSAYGLDTEIAYDGYFYQYFDKRINTLCVCFEDTAVAGLSLPHPILEWFQFAYPLTDDNEQYRVRLKDIKAHPPDVSGTEWTIVQQGEEFVEQAVFPGGTYDDTTYTYRVSVIPGDRRKPIRIERIRSNDSVVTRAEFSEFSSAGNGSNSEWPRSVVLRTFGEDNTLLAEMSFVITELSVNGPLPSMACTINWLEATRIWHSDIQAFIQ